jgi:pyruvate,water dikinase
MAMFYLHDWGFMSDPLPQYGSKAANLGRLWAEGFRVPNGVVFAPTDNLGPLTKFPDKLTSILESIENNSLRRRPHVNGGTWAVRSSGLAEDGEDSSFAGQHDTYLHVKSEDILDRIRDCRESGSKAEAYREAKGEADKGIAVLVQMMVPAWLSGVTFTANPFSMELGTSVIEYTLGLGDKLVAGEVDPEGSYDVNNATETFTPTVSGSAELLLQVQRTCQEIASSFGKPMDIEWAIDADTKSLWILQARPLTTGGRVWKYPEFKGRSVVTGRAEGIARWANTVEPLNSKFDKGNILLAHMTTPHMVPLMMKASGIATQIGGRTCHAAIISRELNKPCVVGIGNLNALQNDTRIVLDATAGMVFV